MRACRTAIAAACAIAFLAAGPPARAQGLPRIHIVALGMHADRRTVRVGETFHITIRVQITERRTSLDELVLPTLDNLTDLGDERRHAALPNGTEFTEVLTVAAQAPGVATLTPAYIDAIDPTSGRALRYSSNPLRIGVGAGEGIDSTTRTVYSWLRSLFVDIILVIAGIVVSIVVLFSLIAIRRKRRTAAPPATSAAVPMAVTEPPRSQVQRLRDALGRLRASDDDNALYHLRVELFAIAGVARGATLADALRAKAARDPLLARALATADRAWFGPRELRPGAVRDTIAAVEAFLAADRTGSA